jgi:hypothetical protein
MVLGHGGVTTVVSGFADLTILQVEGGVLGNEGLRAPARLPYILPVGSGTSVFVRDATRSSRAVAVTFSMPGRTSTQQFAVRASECGR